jgi:lysophospholipase L1-like esterase
MFVMTILIAFLIAVTAHPDSWFSKWLDNPVLNYLGTRSYSIYLYQLPVFVFVDRLTQNNSSVPLQLFKIAIVLGLSELSYRYIENVFRRFKKVALGQQPLLRLKQSRGLQIAAAVAIIFIVGTANAISAKAAGQPKPKTTLEKTLAANKSKIDAANKKAEAAAKAAKSSTATSTSSESASSSQASSQSSEVSTANDPIAVKYGLTDAELAKVKGIAMTAVGDSVMLDVAPDLQEAMPATVVDGQVGRQTASVPGVLQSIANRGALANTVLITIGTNGSISAKNIDDIMAIIGATRRVYWVTPYADRVWIPGNMYELNQALQRYSNLTLIDWKALVEKDNNRATWLGADGVHPNQAGDLAYASLVVKDIANAQ